MMDHPNDRNGTVSTARRGCSPALLDKDAWAAQKQWELEDVYAQINAAAEQMIGGGELFRNYLDVQARFDRYSVGNAILITLQHPTATRLADYHAWMECGAHIKKDEPGIVILEPGKEYRREDGGSGVYYHVKKVYDISQTSYQYHVSRATAADAEQLIRTLAVISPCDIRVTNVLPEGADACYHKGQDRILLRQGMDAAAVFRGLSQALARVYMARSRYRFANPVFSACCVSYMLCRRNGIAVDQFSFVHLPKAIRRLNAQTLRRELRLIREVAGELSADMKREAAAQRDCAVTEAQT